MTFEALWTDYLEGELKEAGLAELDALLAADPALARQAARLYAEHRALGLLHASEETDDFVRATLARARGDRERFVASVTGDLRPPARRWKDLALVAAATLVFSLIVQGI